MNETWRQQAACAQLGVPTAIFFSDEPGEIEEAKRICATCPVIEKCREYAHTNRVEGVWAGERFHNGVSTSLLIKEARQEAEELGLRDPDATRGEATVRSIISFYRNECGHIRDLLKYNYPPPSPGDDGASPGEGGG